VVVGIRRTEDDEMGKWEQRTGEMKKWWNGGMVEWWNGEMVKW
jgi:hypothetical protein